MPADVGYAPTAGSQQGPGSTTPTVGLQQPSLSYTALRVCRFCKGLALCNYLRTALAGGAINACVFFELPCSQPEFVMLAVGDRLLGPLMRQTLKTPPSLTCGRKLCLALALGSVFEQVCPAGVL